MYPEVGEPNERLSRCGQRMGVLRDEDALGVSARMRSSSLSLKATRMRSIWGVCEKKSARRGGGISERTPMPSSSEVSFVESVGRRVGRWGRTRAGRRLEPGRELGGGGDVTGDERAKVKRRDGRDSAQGWGGEESS